MIMFVTKADVKKMNGMNGVACEMSTSDEERYSHVVKFQLTGKGMNFMCLTLFSPYCSLYISYGIDKEKVLTNCFIQWCCGKEKLKANHSLRLKV